MFRQSFINENVKLYRQRLLWVELIVIALLVILLCLVLYSALRNNPLGAEIPAEGQILLQQLATWPDSLNNMLSIAGGNAMGGLMLVVLAGAVTAQEYSYRSYQLWLSRGVPRPTLIITKYLSLIIPAGLIVLTPLLVGGLITAFITHELVGHVSLGLVDFPKLGLNLVKTIYTLMPYGALAFLLAVATRSTVVAIGAGLAYTLLGESLLMQLVSLLGEGFVSLTRFMPGNLAASLIRMNDIGDTASLLSPSHAAIAIAVWTVCLVGFAIGLFQRQDLTA